jgi:hypothetical protein
VGDKGKNPLAPLRGYPLGRFAPDCGVIGFAILNKLII